MPSSRFIIESPRIASSVDLPTLFGVRGSVRGLIPEGDQSLQGHTAEAAEDFPPSPHKEFRSSRLLLAGPIKWRVASTGGLTVRQPPYIATGFGPSHLHLRCCFGEEVGVWPLRIPQNRRRWSFIALRSFLLIVRTGWIFTARMSSPNEYHRILGVSSI